MGFIDVLDWGGIYTLQLEAMSYRPNFSYNDYGLALKHAIRERDKDASWYMIFIRNNFTGKFFVLRNNYKENPAESISHREFFSAYGFLGFSVPENPCIENVE